MFSEDLTKAMKEGHVSQTDLAEYLRVTPGAVKFWMNGTNRPNKERLKVICDLLDMSYEKYVREFALARKSKGGYMKNRDFDGEKLRKAMSDKKLTCKTVAKYCGVTPKAVGNWTCNYRPNYDNLVKLSNLFDVDVEYWSTNVTEPFTPKVKADPKVIAREKDWKNPYNRDLSVKPKGKPIEPDPIEAPVISTPVVEVKDLTDEEIEKVKKMVKEIKNERIEILPVVDKKEDIDRLNGRIDKAARLFKQMQEKVDLIDFDYRLQVNALNDKCDKLEAELDKTNEALNGIRKLIVDHLLVKNEEKPDVTAEIEKAKKEFEEIKSRALTKEKKGFWARLWE